jgi:two-component system, OmpR family, sensor kinase
MTLRARLVAGLLVVTAAGLLLLGGITYAEQRSFQLERADDQARSALPFVARALDDHGGDRPPRGGDGDRPPRDLINLPTGTFGQQRDADGTPVGAPVVLGSFGATDPAAPELPANLPAGEIRTVKAKGDSGLRYRALAVASPGGTGTTVVAVPLSEVDRTLDRLLLVESIVFGGVLLVLGLVGWLLVGLGLRPLDRMGETAGAIAAGDLDRRVSPAEARTEVGRLGLALNAMLERLERAFGQREASEQRLRRFIADASHELRTPLASIRGYAELFRMGAARRPEDTEKAMRRIEEEAARMGVLVDDLLTLARLDEVLERPHAPVDLSALARDAVHDARATDGGRRIDLHPDERADAIVLGDEDQLRQVLANLVRNALVHTPAGTAVDVAVRAGAGHVELEVTDEGPGLPTDEPHALFERFWPAEGGRERGRAGSGLGLAIVARIVEAHGGSVHAGAAEGGGARFVVTLPSASATITRESTSG